MSRRPRPRLCPPTCGPPLFTTDLGVGGTCMRHVPAAAPLRTVMMAHISGQRLCSWMLAISTDIVPSDRIQSLVAAGALRPGFAQGFVGPAWTGRTYGWFLSLLLAHAILHWGEAEVTGNAIRSVLPFPESHTTPRLLSRRRCSAEAQQLRARTRTVAHCNGSGDCFQSPDWLTVMRVTHLTQSKPRWSGITRRAGNP